MAPLLIFTIRLSLALVWLYNGLWLKIIASDPHHLAIVSTVAPSVNMDPLLLLHLIGSGETLLGLGILSGLLHRFVSFFQITIVLLMNVIGGFFGGGTVEHPFGLIISNLPTVMCATVVAMYGPGAFALPKAKRAVGANHSAHNDEH